ncbi:MAG: hypothetical protein OXG35_03000 [Acidobacteria bacterium]|nr:hypothetical protein [Acidobacteriota bacterium]
MTRPLPLIAAILCAGAALQALLWSRQWIYGDQYALLLSGIGVLETGNLPPFAKTMSGGGRIPGALLPLLIAAPLEMWADYRAPGLLIGLSHLAAAAILSVCIGRALGARFLAAYLAVYWLSPWRLYHAGFVWEPAYVFLPAALHLASAYRLRERPHRGWSLLHAATLTLALQLHGSFLVLVLLTAGLAAGRRIRLDVRGCVLGVLAGGLTLVPTALAFVAGRLPRILPGNTDELSPVLVGLVNLPKSLAYWWRLGSLYIGRRLEQTVYAEAEAAASGAETAFASGLTSVVIAVSTVSVALAVFASWRYFRRHPSFDPDDRGRRRPQADWLRAYAGWCLAALCAAATLSPVPVQGWHVVIAFHAACLPVAAWLDAAFRAPSRLLRAGAATFILLEVVVVLLLAFGHPMYRPVSGDALLRQDLPDAVRPLIPDRPR